MKEIIAILRHLSLEIFDDPFRRDSLPKAIEHFRSRLKKAMNKYGINQQNNASINLSSQLTKEDITLFDKLNLIQKMYKKYQIVGEDIFFISQLQKNVVNGLAKLYFKNIGVLSGCLEVLELARKEMINYPRSISMLSDAKQKLIECQQTTDISAIKIEKVREISSIFRRLIDDECVNSVYLDFLNALFSTDENKILLSIKRDLAIHSKDTISTLLKILALAKAANSMQTEALQKLDKVIKYIASLRQANEVNRFEIKLMIVYLQSLAANNQIDSNYIIILINLLSDRSVIEKIDVQRTHLLLKNKNEWIEKAGEVSGDFLHYLKNIKQFDVLCFDVIFSKLEKIKKTSPTFFYLSVADSFLECRIAAMQELVANSDISLLDIYKMQCVVDALMAKQHEISLSTQLTESKRKEEQERCHLFIDYFAGANGMLTLAKHKYLTSLAATLHIEHPESVKQFVTEKLTSPTFFMKALLKEVPLQDFPACSTASLFLPNSFNYNFYHYQLNHSYKVYNWQLNLALQQSLPQSDKQNIVVGVKKVAFDSKDPNKAEYKKYLHAVIEYTKRIDQCAGLSLERLAKYNRENNPTLNNMLTKAENRYDEAVQEKSLFKAMPRRKYDTDKNGIKDNVCQQFILRIKQLIENTNWVVSTFMGLGGVTVNGRCYPTHVARMYQHCLHAISNNSNWPHYFDEITALGLKAAEKTPFSFFGLGRRGQETTKFYKTFSNACKEADKKMIYSR